MNSLSGRQIRLTVKAQATEIQAMNLQLRLAASGLKVQYQEEQHGPALIVSIECADIEEPIVRGIFRETGIALPEKDSD